MANENAPPEQLPIIFAKGTDVGRARDHNEDYVDAFSSPDPAQRRQKGALFVVADGMGGHQAGDVASRTAVQVISHEYYADPEPDPRVSLSNAIQRANTYIYGEAQQTSGQAGMGTTVVAAVIRGNELFLANVGDSRAYWMRQGTVTQATQDHSFVADQVRAGLLSPEEARAHPQRNVITRALGSRPDVKVDIYSGELRSEDVLLLCTDGLSEYVHEEDMLAILGHYVPEEAVPRLIALANSRGGADNISAIVIQVGQRRRVAATQPLAPAALSSQVPRPRRRSILPWIVGIIVFAVIAALAGVLAVFVAPPLLDRRASATPSPEASPTSGPTPTMPPTVTLLPTESPPTVTPAFSLSGMEPVDGAVVSPGEVTFSWGPLSWADQFTAAVRTERQELCRVVDGTTCQAYLPEGDYTWWIEVLVNGQKVYQGDPYDLTVRLSATSAATPTVTLTPALTSTATLTVTTTPE